MARARVTSSAMQQRASFAFNTLSFLAIFWWVIAMEWIYFKMWEEEVRGVISVLQQMKIKRKTNGLVYLFYNQRFFHAQVKIKTPSINAWPTYRIKLQSSGRNIGVQLYLNGG